MTGDAELPDEQSRAIAQAVRGSTRRRRSRQAHSKAFLNLLRRTTGKTDRSLAFDPPPREADAMAATTRDPAGQIAG